MIYHYFYQFLPSCEVKIIYQLFVPVVFKKVKTSQIFIVVWKISFFTWQIVKKSVTQQSPWFQYSQNDFMDQNLTFVVVILKKKQSLTLISFIIKFKITHMQNLPSKPRTLYENSEGASFYIGLIKYEFWNKYLQAYKLTLESIFNKPQRTTGWTNNIFYYILPLRFLFDNP